jgi:hypothetical protein
MGAVHRAHSEATLLISREPIMRNLATIALTALLALNAAVLAATSGQLPARVASQFNGQGFGASFMPHDAYLMLMTALALGLPLLVALVLVAVPRAMPARLRVPSRDYWLAPERRGETLDTVTTAGLLIASLLAAFVIAVHLLVVQANHRAPPRIDMPTLYTLVALLIVAILGWQFLLWRRFQVPR